MCMLMPMGKGGSTRQCATNMEDKLKDLCRKFELPTIPADEWYHSRYCSWPPYHVPVGNESSFSFLKEPDVLAEYLYNGPNYAEGFWALPKEVKNLLRERLLSGTKVREEREEP